jgi:hypothetical protein
MIETHLAKSEFPSDTPFDDNAALQWAVESFRRNSCSLRDGGTAKEWLAYNKTLLLHLKKCVEIIQHKGAQAIVVPESFETLHRIDNEELLDLIRGAREGHETTHAYILAVAAALIENGDCLPGPLKEFVVEFLREPQKPRTGPGRKRSKLFMRDNYIGFVMAMICIHWKFFPTRNDATIEPSAASIAQKALEQVGIHLTEPAINKVWNKSEGKRYIPSERNRRH